VYAYQLHYGALPASAGQVVIRHQCDETSCQNWEDLVTGTQPDNVRDYQARRGREGGPLADRRGARGRAVAIRAAILTARRTGTSIEEAGLKEQRNGEWRYLEFLQVTNWITAGIFMREIPGGTRARQRPRPVDLPEHRY
jgi:hypothetical protein